MGYATASVDMPLFLGILLFYSFAVILCDTSQDGRFF